jgi:cell division protein FtsA
VKIAVPDNLKKQQVVEETIAMEEMIPGEKMKNRKGMKDFWGKFKDGLIEIFKDEEDHAL